MILVTGHYLDPDPGRRRELLECVRLNALNETIDEIHILAEPPVDPSNLLDVLCPSIRSKLRVALHHRRLTFADLFACANRLPTGSRVIVGNADIYFDASLRRLRNFELSGKLLCLSRWDVQADGSTRFFEHPASQDAWIFESPMRAFPCDFPLGIPACDNRLAWEAAHAGLAVSNPSRSIHANHLHLSGVRRYMEQQRLSGPTRLVPAKFLDTPWLWFVVSALGDPTDLSDTLRSVGKQACSSCIVVSRPPLDEATGRAVGDMKNVSLVAVTTAPSVTAARAWNCGAAAADPDGALCFLNAGTVVDSGFAEHAFARYVSDQFLVLEESGSARTAALICGKSAFLSVGGFNETIADPARAQADLRAALGRARLQEKTFCNRMLTYWPDGGPSAGGVASPDLVTREPLAAVAFREQMGFTVARLAPGVSSHNNDTRPIEAVPDVLIGRAFTQAVACCVSPIKLEFLHSGKLYILVGTDWEGFHMARAWLAGKATKETLPPVTTARGTGFEIWSLQADAGEMFEIPTQVVLVGDWLARDCLRLPESRSSEQLAIPRGPIAALTSLAPGRDHVARQRIAVASWKRTGLEVYSFNHPSEIDTLHALYDVVFVPVLDTAKPVFGRHCIPISTMLAWAAAHGGPVLLINADVELQMVPWEMTRLRWVCDGQLCYFVRHNYDQTIRHAVREASGIDAFLFNGGDAPPFANSLLSMGQPFWDYWIPHSFASRNAGIFAIEAPVLFHKNHPRQWSDTTWHRCALEFDRLFGLLGEDKSMGACMHMSARVRASFDSRKVILSTRPPLIRDWVQRRFSYRGPKLFLELGAHDGSDTAWMAALPDVAIHAFEPDPRNRPPQLPNVTLIRAAISDRDGRAPFVLSAAGWGRLWTHSSSLKRPKNHLFRYPVTFGETIEVDAITLDTHGRREGLGPIDFIWADIQGAEGEMIRGGRELLTRTRFLYTEYSDDELYEGQPSLRDICSMLPEFRVRELWPDDVLFENREMVP